jgi:hypothetical protein
MIPIWVSVLTGPAADKASGHWDLDFDTLDLELNRPFFIGKWLSLDPKIGMRGAWIDQHYNVKYHALFPTSTTILIRNTSFRSNESFKGVGIKMGSDLKFYLCKSLSILGNLSTSILWGKLTLHEKIKGYIVIDPTTTLPEIVKFNNNFTQNYSCKIDEFDLSLNSNLDLFCIYRNKDVLKVTFFK